VAQTDINTQGRTFTAVAQASAGVLLNGDFLILLKGAFVGTIIIERRLYGSTDVTDFLPVMLDTAGTPVELTKPGVYAFSEPSVQGAEYRAVAKTLTSGTPVVSFDQ